MPSPRGVLAARNISRFHADVAVIDDLSLTIAPGARIGLVGPNGIGKSTLLRILAGLEPPDSGRVDREPAGLAVGYLPQSPAAFGCSPGEAARAALEQLIADGPDVMLLDEPTNDLDEAGLQLVDRLVAGHRGGMLLASHDRALLEHMASIVELEAETRRVATYTGGWSEFDAARRRARERHEAAFGAYREQLQQVEEQAVRMQRWQQRGYGQGRKKKKTRDAGRAIEQRRRRVQRVEKPWSPWRLQLTLSAERRSGEAVAGLERAVIARGAFELGPVDLELRRGERLSVTGPNGAGKSTLLAAILGTAPLASGRRWTGPSTVLATLPQRGGPFAGSVGVLDAFCEASGLAPQEARALLAKFGLGADHVARAGGSISPGERTRAALALVVATGANTLILDEPTNNLDLEAIEQLEAALSTFDGTVVLVSHDRRFLEAFGATRTVSISGWPARPRAA